MEYYILECDSPMYGIYAALDPNNIDQRFQMACQNSLFQLIYPDKADVIYVAADSDDNYTDFMYDYGNRIPLVSERFKVILEDSGCDNILFKKIILRRAATRMDHECWLALPSRIDCLDFELSVPKENGLGYEKMVISESKAGRYDIFKVSRKDDRGAAGPEIIVSERLKEFIERSQEEQGIKLECVYFNKL